jgi:hypothetical protein
MTSIEQALYTVIALVILIGIIYLFFSVFGSTECDKLSNTTAVELTNAINKVALGQDVLPWEDSSKAPPDESTDYYTIVPIRLCEKNKMNTMSALFSAQSPTYILTYETFPEAGYAWSESQPFSGGAPESLINYGVMKYGLKFGSIVGKYVVKGAKALWNGGWSLFKLKIQRWFDASRLKRWLDNNKHYNAVKNYLRRHFSSSTQTTIQETIEDKLNKKNYPDELKGIADKIRYYQKELFLEEEESLLRVGLIDGAPDEAGNWIPKKLYDANGNGQYIVKQEYRKFMQLYIENTGEASEMYKGLYHIPSRWGSAFEKFKIEKWRPFKYAVKGWWQNRWVKKAIDKVREFYDNKIKKPISGIKDSFNDWFNHKEGAGVLESSQDIGAIKNYLMLHRDEATQEMKDNFVEFKGPLQEITGKVFNKADDIGDDDAIRLINSYERYYSANELVLYFPRQQDDLTFIGSQFLGKEYYNRAEKVRDLVWSTNDMSVIDAAWQDYNELFIPFKNLDSTKQQGLIDKISEGYINRQTGQALKIDPNVVEDLYEYARVSGFKNGAFTTNLNLMVSQADKVKADMKLASKYVSKRYFQVEKVTDRLLSPIITDQSFSKLKTLTTYGWKRIKRGVFIDLNRVGAAYDPVFGSIPVSIAPYNILSSPYSIKEALSRASEIKEGGCSNNAICRIVRMGAQGPTETANSYLLDRRVPDSIEVKTWRPKPSMLERTPIGINTISLYLSVPENPRFHVVGPCFGLAKVWKNGDNVFVSIEKDEKCNVNCKQENIQLSTPSSVGVPFTDWSIPLPSFNIGTAGPSSVDTPNYCYADEEFIWGGDLGKGGDAPYAEAYLPGYAACVLICSAATQGTGTKVCLKSCGYAAIGILTVNTLAATQAYRDVPSWKRQETGWGYWNYQKAMDICDTIDFISSFGSFNTPTQKVQALPSVGFKTAIPVQTGRLQKVLSTSGKNIQKISKYTTIGIGDLCTVMQLMGDTSLAWPIKTPIPEFYKKAAVLDDKCMQESASQCAWLTRCDPPNLRCPVDPQTNIEMECIEGVCKKRFS